jgi:hypothetical protein
MSSQRFNQGELIGHAGVPNMAASITLTKQEFDALVLRTPRSRLGKM